MHKGRKHLGKGKKFGHHNSNSNSHSDKFKKETSHHSNSDSCSEEENHYKPNQNWNFGSTQERRLTGFYNDHQNGRNNNYYKGG